jgi:hypothetical protein
MLVEETEQKTHVSRLDPEAPREPRWFLVLLIACPLIILNAFWIANSEMKTEVTEVTISTLFSGVLFFLFLLTIGNLAVRRFCGTRWSLTRQELLVLYILLSLSSSISGVGNIGFFTPFLVSPFYYANSDNGWRSLWHDLPWYIGPRDNHVLDGYFNGHSSFFHRNILHAWAGPLLVWSAFILVLLFTLLCLAVILRRRWADEEQLPFPVVTLPLSMTRSAEPGDTFYKNRLLWIGFAIPSLFHSFNTIATIRPGVPSLPINSAHDLVPSMAFPWNGVDALFIMVHGSGIGFGYLINLDVSFSLWFFYLLKKVLDVWSVTEGWRQAGQGGFGDAAAQFPYTAFQGMGAWLALGIAALWRGRTAFKGFFTRALIGRGSHIDDGEIMSARTAVLGFAAGFFALCAFSWSSGASLWLPILLLAIYVLIMLAIARIRAETAVPCTELIWINPQHFLTSLCGTEGFSKTDLSHIAMFSWFNTDYRAAAFPHLLEGQVALRKAGSRNNRPLFTVLAIAAAVALAAALIASLQMYYVNGADTAKVNGWRIDKGSEPWVDLERWLHSPNPVDASKIVAALVGVAVTFGLSALRARFINFPLHPAGYVLNTSFANDFFWLDMFFAWLIKSLVLRYGGMVLYQKLLPLFLGLILGDFVTGAFWSIVGTVFHLDLFRTFAS